MAVAVGAMTWASGLCRTGGFNGEHVGGEDGEKSASSTVGGRPCAARVLSTQRRTRGSIILPVSLHWAIYPPSCCLISVVIKVQTPTTRTAELPDSGQIGPGSSAVRAAESSCSGGVGRRGGRQPLDDVLGGGSRTSYNGPAGRRSGSSAEEAACVIGVRSPGTAPSRSPRRRRRPARPAPC